MSHQYEGGAADVRDGREVPHRIERQLRIGAWIDGDRAGRRRDQRIAIGLGFGAYFGADHARRAGAIVDDETLFQALAHLLEQRAHDDIETAPWRKRIDDPYRPGGIALRESRRRRSAAEASQRD